MVSCENKNDKIGGWSKNGRKWSKKVVGLKMSKKVRKMTAKIFCAFHEVDFQLRSILRTLFLMKAKNVRMTKTSHGMP